MSHNTRLLLQLPEDDTVKEQVSDVEEEELGPDEKLCKKATRETNETSIQTINTLEPEQGEASDANDPDCD
eukprot:4575307-Ditylum_brightwellii.AAC.1